MYAPPGGVPARRMRPERPRRSRRTTVLRFARLRFGRPSFVIIMPEPANYNRRIRFGFCRILCGSIQSLRTPAIDAPMARLLRIAATHTSTLYITLCGCSQLRIAAAQTFTSYIALCGCSQSQ